MFKINKLTDYAMVVMHKLASEPNKVLSATYIANAVHLTTPTVSKILKILAEASLVNSFRGTGGGYQLAKPTTDITIVDILSAIEGKLAMTECCSENKICTLSSLCTIQENWKTINKVILDALSQVTLYDMTRSLLAHPLTLNGISVKVEG